MDFNAILFCVSIIASIYTYIEVSKRIKEEKEFSGGAWGFLNGIMGMGILWVFIVCVLIINKINNLSNKKYAECARRQMKAFVEVYGICISIYIGIILLIFVLTINTPHVIR